MYCTLRNLLIALSVLSGACRSEDTGDCCRVLSTDASAELPQPETPDGGGAPHNSIRVHTAFDCERLTCVSWEGSEAFCTRECDGTHPCPDGFVCQKVLASDPGMGAPIQPDDTFCVRKRCESNADCPEDYECQLAHMGTGADDPTIRHCLRPEQGCARGE